jgi:hypothetical protein
LFIRRLVLVIGARALEQLLAGVLAQDDERPSCGDNHLPKPMRRAGRRPKTIRTILGDVRVERSYYVCPSCGATRLPADERLGVMNTSFSPGARRMMARAGAKESFRESAEDLRLFAELEVQAKDVERIAEETGRVVDNWMARQASLAQLAPAKTEPIDTLYVSFDGTGIPMRSSELTGVRGKGEQGQAKTREVKLGCVFTQTTLDEQGNPVREDASTTYVGAIENSTDFGYRIRAEAERRGMAAAARVGVLTDGAAYNTTIVREHFPDAIHILDLCHARQRLTDFIRDTCRRQVAGPFHQQCDALLNTGQIPTLLSQLRQALPHSGPRRKEGKTRIDYFRKNAHAMRYGEFRAQGLFVGSGVVEAGCKNVIGKRLKQSGMFWSVSGANAIIALRCCFESNRFEQFWEDSA